MTGSADRIYIAMAGAHQLWELNQGDRHLSVLAGNGQLGLVDGGGGDSAFAQPSDLVMIDQTLFVADAASSAIRSLHLPSGHVYTLIGHGPFEFGCVDGGRAQASLQYPCAAAVDPRVPSQLWIADTFNNRLRCLRLAGNELKQQPIDHPLAQPAAMTASSGLLWIANTDAHEVLRCDLGDFSVRRLPIGE